ncbi:MAG: GntR family transcriptional regulator [Acidimicrobiales bacterium]
MSRSTTPAESRSARRFEVLKADGLVDARQGAGWFVAADPVPQPLTSLATIEAQLAASGRQSERRVVDFGFGPAPRHVAPLLGQRVLIAKRVNLADGQPFARVTVWCREDLGAELSLADVERSTFYSLLPHELGRASQTIGAAAAGSDDARLLGVPEQSPVLVVKRTTFDAGGHAVLVSEHVFPGHVTEFVVELAARSDLGESPTGLRLVDGEAPTG